MTPLPGTPLQDHVGNALSCHRGDHRPSCIMSDSAEPDAPISVHDPVAWHVVHTGIGRIITRSSAKVRPH